MRQDRRADADINRARNDGLQCLAAALGIENLELKPMLGKDATALTKLGNRSIPIAALTDRHGHLIQVHLILGIRHGRTSKQSADH
jgi:hypothetical protein